MTIAVNPFVRTTKTETEARGFALYVGIDEATAEASGTTLGAIVAALRNTLEEIAPGLAAETFASVALAKSGSGGRHVDIVRAALSDPRALERLAEKDNERAATGVVIDLQRRKVFVDGVKAELTSKEFCLLQYLVKNQGTTISREELISALWDCEGGPDINGRTIDVHVRRLRASLSGNEDIVRTIRGEGYRFDKHPDVLIEGI
jgi:DNA-binding response OmpR family regulator